MIAASILNSEEGDVAAKKYGKNAHHRDDEGWWRRRRRGRFLLLLRLDLFLEQQEVLQLPGGLDVDFELAATQFEVFTGVDSVMRSLE